MAQPNRFYYSPAEITFPLQFFAPMFTDHWKAVCASNQRNERATSQKESTETSEARESIVPINTTPPTTTPATTPTTAPNEVRNSIVPVNNTASTNTTSSNEIEVLNTNVSSYRGDLRNPNNHSAPIPAIMSTSVFISELSPKSNIHDVLAEIRDCGKVWASNIVPAQGEYVTAAAKVVFWDRLGLERFLHRWMEGNFVVNGRLPKVVMNDYYSAPKAVSTSSRAIQISGPSDIVNEQYLCRFFSANFKYDIDEIIVLFADSNNDTMGLEVRFASYRAQAAAAFKRINDACRGKDIPNYVMTEMEKFLWRGVSVAYGRDPCEW